MRKSIILVVVALAFGVGCAATEAAVPATRVNTVSDDSKSEAECGDASDSLETEIEAISADLDSIDPLDRVEVAGLIRDNRRFVTHGRTLLAQCGEHMTSSERIEFADLLDEYEESTDELDDTNSSR